MVVHRSRSNLGAFATRIAEFTWSILSRQWAARNRSGNVTARSTLPNIAGRLEDEIACISDAVARPSPKSPVNKKEAVHAVSARANPCRRLNNCDSGLTISKECLESAIPLIFGFPGYAFRAVTQARDYRRAYK